MRARSCGLTPGMNLYHGAGHRCGRGKVVRRHRARDQVARDTKRASRGPARKWSLSLVTGVGELAEVHGKHYRLMADTSPRPPGRPRRVVRSIPLTIGALRAIDAKAIPDLKRAVPAVLTTMTLFGVGERLGAAARRNPARFNMFGNTLQISGSNLTIAVLALTLLLVISGLIATRSIGRELARVVSARGGVEAGNAIRLVCFMAGYAILGLGVLALLHVNLANLLVGGAVTGVVLGIAAQQTLGNFFAGLVLLFARPYVPGQQVKIRSGALGTFEGTITGSGLMYTTIDTSEGLISLPNSGLLAAAIGPAPGPEATDQDLPVAAAAPQRQRGPRDPPACQGSATVALRARGTSAGSIDAMPDSRRGRGDHVAGAVRVRASESRGLDRVHGRVLSLVLDRTGRHTTRRAQGPHCRQSRRLDR